MSRVIIFFILANLLFDHEQTRVDRWKQDRFAAARELLELFNEQRFKYLMAYDYLRIDETILFYSNHHSLFKQFNLSKPAKYALLFKSINAFARYPYTFVTKLYAHPQNECGQFYHPGRNNVTEYLTEHMDGKQIIKRVQHVFRPIDTSFTVATWLLNKKHVTCIGTLMANRKDILLDVNPVNQILLE